MHIEYMVTKNPRTQRGLSGCNSGAEKNVTPAPNLIEQGSVGGMDAGGVEMILPTPTQAETYLLNLTGMMHNASAAQLLCAATFWAYSDLKTFASMMCHRGLYGEFVGINVTNEVGFVNTTAYLFVSESRRLAVLAFRGTELTNIVNWLGDANTEMVAQEEGMVHGGFLNASIAVLPILQRILLPWAEGSMDSLADTLISLSRQSCYPDEVFPTSIRLAALEKLAERKKLNDLLNDEELFKEGWGELKAIVTNERMSTENRLETLEKLAKRLEGTPPEPGHVLSKPRPGLFICGHSLGGAFAAMAGTLLYLDPTLDPVRTRLRSIYTFGAPMFADKTLADVLEKDLGKQVFRHRYGKDVVPLLPGKLQGDFRHFGAEYVNSRQKNDVWVRTSEVGEPVFGSLPAMVIGLLAWAKEKVPMLGWLPLPFSWADHEPLRYMRTSQAPRAGWEILGQELLDELSITESNRRR